MDMSGEQTIAAPREIVWEALNDPDVLKECIPGCEEVNKTSDTSFDAKVSAKVGPVKAKFSGSVTLSDLDPPKSYKISGEGKGGAAGFAKGGAKVNLEELEGGNSTKLTYDVNASIGGKLAQIGARLIDSTAKKYANDFFSKFTEIAEARAADGGAAATPEPTSEAKPAVEAEAKPAEPAAPAPKPEPKAQKPEEKPAEKKEEKPVSTDPLAAKRKELGVPDENVYDSTHWTVYLSWGVVALMVVLFFLYAAG